MNRVLFYFILLLVVGCNSEKRSKVDIKLEQNQKKLQKQTKQKKVKDTLNHKNSVAFFKAYGKENMETKVRFETRLGNIDIELFKDTPLHRANFIFLVKKGYFDTTCFHRVVPNFIAQGGNSESFSTSNFRNKYKNYQLPPEFRKNRKHLRGSIAIARDWENNPKKLSTPFEFYITVKNEPHLNFEHTVFGRVIRGMNVVDKITRVKRGKDDWPDNDVFIKAKILTNWHKN
jgi:peptidylprolyl isomerase